MEPRCDTGKFTLRFSFVTLSSVDNVCAIPHLLIFNKHIKIQQKQNCARCLS